MEKGICDNEDDRPELPDYNDRDYPQDEPEGTFRGTQVTLADLLDDDIDWVSVFSLFPLSEDD